MPMFRRPVALRRTFAGGFVPRGVRKRQRLLAPPAPASPRCRRSSPEAAQANIASLTDVIQRNPNSAEAYNTRGVAYARIGQYRRRDRRFHPGDPSRSQRCAGADQSRARLSADRSRRSRRSPISTRRSPPIRTTPPPISAAPICCARRASSKTPAPISMWRSASIPRARRPITRAA